MEFSKLKELLERESSARNNTNELCDLRPDPLLIAKNLDNDLAILACALFAYGNAKQIVKFLSELDFSLLQKSPDSIHAATLPLYRFQNRNDVKELFLSLNSIFHSETSLKDTCAHGFQNNGILGAIHAMQTQILEHADGYSSDGFMFLIGNPHAPSSPLKRWNMFLRWMVRRDELDLGRWEDVIPCSELLLPLDTHTFRLCKKLGILQRKSYDFKSVIEATEFLKRLDERDPIKYDFALYRLGQEKILP
ncbi:MAG: TIGR02757 family protein [Wolinella sp.]